MLYLLFYVTLACKHFDFLFAIIYMYKILFISIIIACSKLSVYLFGLLILILLLFCIKTTFKFRFSYTSQLKLKPEIFIPLNWYVYYFMLFLLFLLYIIFEISTMTVSFSVWRLQHFSIWLKMLWTSSISVHTDFLSTNLTHSLFL